MRRVKALQFLVLGVSGCGLAWPAAVPESHDLPGNNLTLLSSSGWVLADFDGDSKPDVATAKSGQSDAQGFQQEVRINLGRRDGTSFKFHSSVAKVDLSVWDVDHDDDWDIFIVDALSKRPIGVWLNDGKGAFSEGDLGTFNELLAGYSGAHWSVTFEPKSISVIVQQHRVIAILFESVTGLDRDPKLFEPIPPEILPTISGSGLCARAPPR